MGFDITTPNLDPSRTNPVTGQSIANPGFEDNLNRVSLENVTYDARPKPKHSFWAGFLHALGGFAPLAYLAAPFTGGLSLIAGAAMQGAGAIGAKAQANNRAQQQQAGKQPVIVNYPGMMPAASLASDPTLTTLVSSRDAASAGATQGIGH